MPSAPDPLGWSGYPEQWQRLNGIESVSFEVRAFGAHEAVVIEFDFRFLGGSIGSLSGQAIVDAFDLAATRELPVVALIATGGSRMQEGMISLRQLQRVAAQRVRHRQPLVSVLRDPTTGGVWASLGASADVILAVDGAQIGFAGRRVRPQHGPAYTADGQFEAGSVDVVVTERDLVDRLTQLLGLLTPNDLRAEVPRALGRLDLPETGWEAVQRARAKERPRAKAYLDDHFEVRFPLNGDRAGGRDPGMLCGIGQRGGRNVVYAAQTGTATTPAGFRTAARVIRLADRLKLPVLTIVDTPGAANDIAAERAGAGPAIAEVFTAVAAAKTPITTLVIGEGGSGGALALAAPEDTWITPDAYFSVIAPELAAYILKRTDPESLAGQLKLRPQDLVELGVVRGVVGG